MDNYTDLLLQLEEVQKAKELIQKSISLNPDSEGRKYLNLAEMLTGHESLKMYRKGIEVLTKDYDSYSNGCRREDAALAKK